MKGHTSDAMLGEVGGDEEKSQCRHIMMVVIRFYNMQYMEGIFLIKCFEGCNRMNS